MDKDESPLKEQREEEEEEEEWRPKLDLDTEDIVLTDDEKQLMDKDYIRDPDERDVDPKIEEFGAFFNESYVLKGKDGEDIVVGAGIEDHYYDARKEFIDPVELEKAKQLAVAMAVVADEMKCQNVRVLDVHTKRDWCDYFVILSAMSSTQLRAVLGKMEKVAREEWEITVQEALTRRSEWEGIDLGTVVVHAFSPRARTYYQLEELYKNCAEVPVQFGEQDAAPQWRSSYDNN